MQPVSPVVSRSEEERNESQFIDEWHQAKDRATAIVGRKFIMPVCIDTDADESTVRRYSRARSLFGALEFGLAPGGRLSVKLRDALTAELWSLRI